jgi:hypothetical protein
MLVGIGGVPYVAWQELGASGTQVHVRRWTGSTWAALGSSLNINPNDGAGPPALADIGGVPYVAFSEGGPPQVYVERWSGSSWTPVGNVTASYPSDEPSLADVGGTPYIAFREPDGFAVDQIYVEHWTGSGWVPDGASLNVDSTQNARNPSIANDGGVPYVAWGEDLAAGGGAVFVRDFAQGYWESDGGALDSRPLENGSNPSLTVIAGVPYVALEETPPAGPAQVRVMDLSGGAWNQIGQPLNTSLLDTAFYPSLTGVGGVPYVAWGEANMNGSWINADFLAPDFSAEQAIATDKGMLLSVRVRDYGAQLPIGFQYGPHSTLTTSTSTQTTDGTGSATIDEAVTGLSPATPYSWRPFATDGTDTTAIGPTQTLTTEPANGPGPPGNVELVVCKQVHKTVIRRVHGHRKRVRITVKHCTTKLVTGPVNFTTLISRRH